MKIYTKPRLFLHPDGHPDHVWVCSYEHRPRRCIYEYGYTPLEAYRRLRNILRQEYGIRITKA